MKIGFGRIDGVPAGELLIGLSAAAIEVALPGLARADVNGPLGQLFQCVQRKLRGDPPGIVVARLLFGRSGY